MTRAEKIVGIGLLLLMCGIMAVLQNCDGTSKNEREARVAAEDAAWAQGAERFKRIVGAEQVRDWVVSARLLDGSCVMQVTMTGAFVVAGRDFRLQMARTLQDGWERCSGSRVARTSLVSPAGREIGGGKAGGDCWAEE